MTRLVALVGPTAAGKSEAALALARRLDAEIVSCDSIAVYRGCDVGAAKPSPAERAEVHHHLLDVADPDEPFTAARYVELADRAIAAIAARGRAILVVGGTGLYLRALVDGLFPSPPPDPRLRAELRAEAEARGWPALHARLAAVDPEAAARIHPGDPVRIERALEVFLQTGTPISALQRAQPRAPRHDALVLILDPPAPILDQRIAARAAAMVAAGLVEETRRLAQTHGRGLKALGAVGYKEALAHLDGRLPASGLSETIRLATRHFARRQRTWFRRQPGRRLESPAALPVAEIAQFLGDVT